MTCYDGPHEPDHPSTRAIDYDCIHCQSNVFLSLPVKVHGSYVKKATTEAPMEVLFTKIEATAARTLRVWKRHT